MRNWLVGFGLSCLLVGAVAFVSRGASAQPLQTATDGRFVVVNGVPSMAAHIMLVDTRTGRTWQVCNSPDSTLSPGATTNVSWCSMGFSGNARGPQ